MTFVPELATMSSPSWKARCPVKGSRRYWKPYAIIPCTGAIDGVEARRSD